MNPRSNNVIKTPKIAADSFCVNKPKHCNLQACLAVLKVKLQGQTEGPSEPN